MIGVSTVGLPYVFSMISRLYCSPNSPHCVLNCIYRLLTYLDIVLSAQYNAIKYFSVAIDLSQNNPLDGLMRNPECTI